MTARASTARVETQVPDTLDALVLDLLEWIGPQPRPYAEVLEAWRTSCPRLPVWEEANERGFIEQRQEPGQAGRVSLSASGAEHLRKSRPSLAAVQPAGVHGVGAAGG